MVCRCPRTSRRWTLLLLAALTSGGLGVGYAVKLYSERARESQARAARDRVEYWAAGVGAYFDAAGQGPPPALADRPIATREALKAYDPDLHALVEVTMAYAGRADWRVKK